MPVFFTFKKLYLISNDLARFYVLGKTKNKGKGNRISGQTHAHTRTLTHAHTLDLNRGNVAPRQLSIFRFYWCDFIRLERTTACFSNRFNKEENIHKSSNILINLSHLAFTVLC